MIALVRRILYLAIAFTIKHQFFQIVALLTLNLTMAMYIGSVKPLLLAFDNKLEIMNELWLHCCVIVLFCFTDWIIKPDDQFQLGWMMISIIQVYCLVNMSIVIKMSFSAVKLIFKKYMRRLYKRMGWNEIEEVEKSKVDNLVKVKGSIWKNDFLVKKDYSP